VRMSVPAPDLMLPGKLYRQRSNFHRRLNL
jgi:hypothetical protein